MDKLDLNRRDFLAAMLAAGAALAASQSGAGAEAPVHAFSPAEAGPAAEPQLEPQHSSEPQHSGDVLLTINGTGHRLPALAANTTLLDCLRDHLHLTGSKKGCGLGHCGACTVLVEGRRVTSCLTLATMQQGKQITTIEGLAPQGTLHPVQAAFVEHDGFQCGYCTPGQILSAVACIQEGHAGSDAEIREWMSGNICRCGAYSNIVAAVREAAGKKK